jgi:hypothetical protein
MSFTGLRTGNFTDINLDGELRVGNDLEPGTSGQVLQSQGETLSVAWANPTSTAVPNPLTMGSNVNLSSGNATWDGSIADTINATDTDTQLNLTGGNGIDVANTGGLNRTITTDNDGITINNSGGTGAQNQVLKVPNTLQITDSAGSSITYDGSVARTITINDNDNQLNLTEGNGITITNTGGFNRTIALNADGTTLSNNVGSGQAGVLKVPNTLQITDSAGTSITYDGSVARTITINDNDTTYQGGKNISIDTTTNPDTINLDDDLTGIDSITFTSTAGSTALTGNNYPNNPTPMTNFDLSSTTNVFPKFDPATAAGVGGLGGIYRDVSNGFLYRFLLPSDFLNDNDSSGYARSVIADSFNHGAQQCYAGSQYYAFFTIPDGYYFSGFRVNLVNSAGTAQGSTPTSSFYVDVRTKNINSNLVQVGTTKGFNTDNLGYTITSGYSDGWDINDPITIGAIHCFRNPWSSSFYNRGGWIQYTQGSPGGGGGGDDY